MTQKTIAEVSRLAAIPVLLAGVLVTTPVAARASTPFTAQASRQRAVAGTRQVQDILARIRADASTLRTAVEQAQPRGRAVGNARAGDAGNKLYAIDDVVQAANDLTDRAGRTQPAPGDVDDFLRHAADLDQAMSSGQSIPRATAAWSRLRASIGDLATAYAFEGDWRNSQTAWNRNAGPSRLTGTFRLSSSQSDNPAAVSDRVLAGVSAADRTRISRQMQYRLTPPDVIAIDGNDGHVTIASSVGPQMTFDADGRSRTETGPAGRTMTTRATSRGDEIEVSTSGSSDSDFSVTFEPLDNGRALRVTRRLYNDALREPVVVRSVYDRTSDVPDWNVYDGRSGRGRGDGRRVANDDTGYADSLIVPTGSTFVATLDNALNVKDARQGDYVSMRVQDGPAAFRNAVIEGYITAEPTRASTRTGLSLAFERIKMPDGRESAFSGTIQSVSDPNGRNIAFDRAEASGDNDNRSDQAIQRGAIGAAVGAILGAVVGGAKGAGIGAAIGAGGGAGTVLLDTQSQQSLPRGTRFTIRSDVQTR